MPVRRRQILPVLLMLVGVSLLLAAGWWAWQNRREAVPVRPALTAPRPAVPALYRPNDSDWWLVLADDPTIAKAALTAVTALDPATPALPDSLPAAIAVAAAGPLRLWQFPVDAVVDLPRQSDQPAQPAAATGRWHLERLPDAVVLFWLPAELQTTAVDRVARPAAGTGAVQQRWLRQRLGWPEQSCEPLPALLQQLPTEAQLRFTATAGQPGWQLDWPNLPATLLAALAKTAAPVAVAGDHDRWFWREADLSVLPRPSNCPAMASGAGFVARLWQEGDELQAALARPGPRSVSGFPLPLPAALQLQPVALGEVAAPVTTGAIPKQAVHGHGVASSDQAKAWLQRQSLQPEPGLLLAVHHHSDGQFAGLHLQLRLVPGNRLQLQFQWPAP